MISSGLSEAMDYHSVDSLKSVTVTASRGNTVSRNDTISVANSFTVSEILLQIPGLQIGDYGGHSGLKSVSLRGFGSPHTSIFIDGIKVGNTQSGQNDLGMLGIENYSNVVIDYAQNSLTFNTVRPVFNDAPVAGRIRLSGGSFGTWLPSARLDFRISEKNTLSINASGNVSKGDFPYGIDGIRINNDIRQVKSGADFFGLTESGNYHIKGYFNSSERGTPGSTAWPSEDRQKDVNVFLQGRLKEIFSDIYTLNISAKGSYDDITYISSWGDSRYSQTEAQLNSSHNFNISKWLSISLAADIQFDRLESTNYDASRLTAFSSVMSSFRHERLSVDISMEYIGAFDRGEDARNAVTPSASLKYQICDGLEISAFGRRAYRIPTFNELYYVGYGNPLLKPENAWLSDIGADYYKKISRNWTIKGRLDGYFNMLDDKITSSPTIEDPNIWLPYNIGKVRSIGFDITGGFVYHTEKLHCTFDSKYSFQSATDRTPGSISYGSHIPYIAVHSVTICGLLKWKSLTINPIWNMRSGVKDAYGKEINWNTTDITLGKSFNLKKAGSFMLKFSAKNIFDYRYELTGGYPMPGRNFIGGIEFVF